MRRNMDLVKEIFSEIRESDQFALETGDFHPGRLPGQWSMKKVSYHLVLLLEADFLARSTLHEGRWDGPASHDEDAEREGAGLRLTWKGHELLDKLGERNSYL